ncbi:rab guanine nucleotide exchange factor S2 [Savitreella phatthalungensis]
MSNQSQSTYAVPVSVKASGDPVKATETAEPTASLADAASSKTQAGTHSMNLSALAHPPAIPSRSNRRPVSAQFLRAQQTFTSPSRADPPAAAPAAPKSPTKRSDALQMSPSRPAEKPSEKIASPEIAALPGAFPSDTAHVAEASREESRAAIPDSEPAPLRASAAEDAGDSRIASLNTKLVAAIERQAELEHLAATASSEASRLRASLASETAARSSAERARGEMERELEDLTRSLFEEANGMVYKKNAENAELQQRIETLEQRRRNDADLLDSHKMQLDELKRVLQRMQDHEDRRHSRKESGNGSAAASTSRTNSPRPVSRAGDRARNRLSRDATGNHFSFASGMASMSLNNRPATPTIAHPSPLTTQDEFGQPSEGATSTAPAKDDDEDKEEEFVSADEKGASSEDDSGSLTTPVPASNYDAHDDDVHYLPRTDTPAFYEFLALLQVGQQASSAQQPPGSNTSSQLASIPANASHLAQSSNPIYRPHVARKGSNLSINTELAAANASSGMHSAGGTGGSTASRPQSPAVQSSGGFLSDYFSRDSQNVGPTSTTTGPTNPAGTHVPGHARQLSITSLRDSKFLKRCISEDIEPVLRLDLSPELGYLGRRAVLNAVIDGSLVVEPQPASLARYRPERTTACSLCGERRQDPASPATASTTLSIDALTLRRERHTRMRTSDKQDATAYALCGFCSHRVRTTCAFIAFLRNLHRGLYPLSHAPAGEGKDAAGDWLVSDGVDRAWRETVRLRKEMFLARVGVVDPSSTLKDDPNRRPSLYHQPQTQNDENVQT